MADKSRYRVLVVEDDRAQRELLLRTLNEHLGDVTEAASVKEAIAAPGPFDVILCDYGLPDGTARDVAAARRDGTFLVISGHDPLPDWNVRWIRKPLSMRELSEAIAQALWARP